MKTSKVLWIWVLVLLLGAAHSAMGAPVNDDCSNAKPVGDVTNLPFDTSLATFDGPGYYITGPNIWFCYTATCTGQVTVNLCGSRFDTKLAVYRGCSCDPTADSLVETNDDDCAKQSRLTFDATAGEQYLIEVGGYGSRTGEGIITIRCEGRPAPVPCQPSNDYCRNASQVGNVTNLSFDTTCATFDGLGHYMTGPNVWYIYTATCTGQVTVDLCGSSFDTRLAIYRGYSCYPTASSIVATDNNACGQQSRVTFNATAGEKFLIEVGGQGSRIGRGVMSIYCAEEPTPPTNNDNCSGAKPVGNVTNLAFDTKSSTFDGPGHYIRSPNIWYCYTATCTGDVTIDLCGSGYDTMLAVYKGCGCYPASSDLVASNDDACSRQSRVTFAAAAGDKFLVEVGGYGSSTGSGIMTISCEGEPGPEPCLPTNDNCNQAKPVGDVKDMAFDTTCATFDGPGHYITSPNIWYLYTAAATGDVTVSLCGSEYDTKLAIYRGAACNPTADKLIKYNDDSCDWQSEATFAATAGQRYLIEVGGFGSRTGKGVITISSEGVTPPPTKQLDLGDAPDSTNNYGRIMTAYQNYVKANFPTVYNDGSGTGPYGPLHRNPQAVAYLGNSVSLEDEADIGSDQDGHNNIWPVSDTSDKDWHDNGVTFPINMPNCSWTTFDYSVKVVTPGTNLWVNVWFDWNRDGDWDDDGSTYPAFNCTKGFVSEWAVQNQFLFLYNMPVGLHKLTTPAFLPWHPKSGPEAIWMRITLSEKPWTGGSNPASKGNGGSGPQAGYDVGETEDYLFTPETACSICEDYSGDGLINIEDLVAFITEWLQSCP
jgi:hypothetical protein